MILENLEDRRRPAGAQGRPDHLHQPRPAGPATLSAPRAVHGRREAEARRDLHRPRIRHGLAPDLVAAAREAGDAGFDVLIACAFNFDAHASEFDKLGRVPMLKAKMNPDLHMAGELKNTGAGNLFVVFGEPDINIETPADGKIRVKVFGVDVFKPQTGEVVSEGTDGIASGSSTPTTTKKASSSATPISSAPTIPTRR